jgi:hypothetical protein
MDIPDPDFSIPYPRSRGQKGNGSRIRIFSIPDPGIKKHWIPDPQHWPLFKKSPADLPGCGDVSKASGELLYDPELECGEAGQDPEIGGLPGGRGRLVALHPAQGHRHLLEGVQGQVQRTLGASVNQSTREIGTIRNHC